VQIEENGGRFRLRTGIFLAPEHVATPETGNKRSGIPADGGIAVDQLRNLLKLVRL